MLVSEWQLEEWSQEWEEWRIRSDRDKSKIGVNRSIPIWCCYSSPDHHYHYHYHRTEVFHRMNPDGNDDDDRRQSWWKSSQINGKMCKVRSFVSFSACPHAKRILLLRLRRTDGLMAKNEWYSLFSTSDRLLSTSLSSESKANWQWQMELIKDKMRGERESCWRQVTFDPFAFVTLVEFHLHSEYEDDSDRWLLVIDMRRERARRETREHPHWSNDFRLSIKMEEKKVVDRFSSSASSLFIRSNHFDQSYPRSNQWFLSLVSLTDLISMSKTNRSALFLDNYIAIDICQSIVKASSAHSFRMTLLTETPEGNRLKCHSLSLSVSLWPSSCESRSKHQDYRRATFSSLQWWQMRIVKEENDQTYVKTRLHLSRIDPWPQFSLISWHKWMFNFISFVRPFDRSSR